MNGRTLWPEPKHGIQTQFNRTPRCDTGAIVSLFIHPIGHVPLGSMGDGAGSMESNVRVNSLPVNAQKGASEHDLIMLALLALLRLHGHSNKTTFTSRPPRLPRSTRTLHTASYLYLLHTRALNGPQSPRAVSLLAGIGPCPSPGYKKACYKPALFSLSLIHI